MEEINLEKNHEQDCHCIKEELFQYIVDESRILNVVEDKKKDKNIFKKETYHQTKDYSIHDQPLRVDFIETWFQRIVGQALQSNFGHIQLIFTLVCFGNNFYFLVASLTYFPIPKFIPQINWMLEWLNWKSTYFLKSSFSFK